MPDEEYTGYERFEPEPTDRQARRTPRPEERRSDSFQDRVTPVVPPPAGEIASGSLVPPLADRPDVTREADDWSARTAPGTPDEASFAPRPAATSAPDDRAAEAAYDEAAYDDDAFTYGYEEWEDGRNRRSGSGAFAIFGFLALGVLALLAGVFIAGVLGGDPNTATIDPTLAPSPTISQSIAASEPPSVAPSIESSTEPSASAGASGDPISFPDGFTAEAQPCIPGSAGGNGCDSNARSNSGSVWVWVGFTNGTQNDVIGAALIGPDGSPVGEGSIDLAQIRCRPACPGGWTYFPFSNLEPGTYDVEITRNGDPAASTTFEVT